MHRITFLERNPTLEPETFSRHWRTDHAEIVKRLPGLTCYAQNHLVRTLAVDGHASFPIAGIVETWYTSTDSANLPCSAPEVFEALLEDERYLLAGSTALEIQGGHTPAAPAWKLWVYADMTAAHLARGVDVIADTFDGVIEVRHLSKEPDVPPLVREGLREFTPQPRAVSAVLFTDERSARVAAEKLERSRSGLQVAFPALQLLLTTEHRMLCA